MARFHGSGNVPTRKRDSFDTNGSYFKFTNVAGIKIEAQGINTDDSHREYAPDMIAFSYGFAYGDGVASTFQTGDVWDYSVCGKAVTHRLFSGKFVAEADPFNTKYETVTPLACT
jgi:hypothetical protein